MIPTLRQQGVDGEEAKTGTPSWSRARLLGRVSSATVWAEESAQTHCADRVRDEQARAGGGAEAWHSAGLAGEACRGRPAGGLEPAGTSGGGYPGGQPWRVAMLIPIAQRRQLADLRLKARLLAYFTHHRLGGGVT
jgi:hypothetical protein